ncbi:MAG: hypothetical protein IJJ23_02995 [Clostridia bacterium]|nr:hypothetical protein [Clostridia bacterium]
MSATYDTEKIREAARQVGRVSRRMDEDVAFQLKKAREALEGLQGKTQRAMEDEILRREKAVTADAQRLNDITSKLRAYANALENADRKIAQILQGKG